MFINDDGRQVNLEINYMNNGDRYEATFRSLDDTDAPAVVFDLSMDAPKKDGLSRKDMFKGNNDLQVHANVRGQAGDGEWMVKGAQWKSQVYLPKNGIWFGSYISEDRNDWTVVFEYKEKEIGRGVWKFGDSPIWQLRDFAQFDASDSKLESAFKVEGDKKLEYVLPKIDDDNGRIRYEMELTGSPLADWITLHKVGKKYTLKFRPGIGDEGKTFKFSLHLLRKGFSKGEEFPMEVTVTSAFDPSKLPYSAKGDKDTFKNEFRFDIGLNRASNHIRAKDRTHFHQTLKVTEDGVDTDVDIQYLYDAEAQKYEVEFQSLNDKNAAPIKVAMATTVSKDDVGQWDNLI